MVPVGQGRKMSPPLGLVPQPHDDLAERAVLAAMVNSGAGASLGLSLLVASDFYDGRYQVIFTAVAELYGDGAPVDPGTVHTWLHHQGKLGRSGGGEYLAQIASMPATVGSLPYYAAIVAELAQRRALADAGLEIYDRAMAGESASSDDATLWAAERIAQVMRGTGDTNPEDAMTETELEMADGPTNWVIPHMLARGDRLMLTGHEGGGKSHLIRQLAVATAAGVDSFYARPMSPQRVMVVDCENGESLSRRKYRPLLKVARAEGAGVTDRFRLYLQSSGVDLTQRAGIGWLLRRVENFKPDLLCIGPLYRLHFGDPNDERDARRIAAALDRAREISGCALILEAHSPHQAANSRKRSVRPVGSSLWLRWPEFGYGLRLSDEEFADRFRNNDLVAWRGPRDERNWPRKVRASGEHGWPWILDEPQRRTW